MRIVILFCCVWLASAGTVPDKCDGVTFDGKYYDKEVLINVKGADAFSLNKDTNTLFFSYYYPENLVKNNQFIGVAYYNIDTKEKKDLPEVVGGTTTAINAETGDVYIGGGDGIYKFNSINKSAVPYAAEGVNIFYLYYSKFLYYTTFPEFAVYSYNGKESKKVSESKVQEFIGDEEKYYFINSTGLYRVLDDEEEKAELFSDSLDGSKVFAKDNSNKIYVTGDFCCVYAPNEEKKKLEKVADIDNIRALVFDKNNNIIYSDDNAINRLTPSEAKCPQDSV